MGTIVTVGLDIAKEVFQIHGVDSEGNVVTRRKLRRKDVADYFRKLAPCVVGIEACASSHYWGRTLIALGHQVKLTSPSFVKPFVMSQRNDAADAAAICEAVGRPGMRFVSVKSADQQAVLCLHGTRALFIRQRTMLINALRSYFAEFGHVTRGGKLGADALRKLVESDGCSFLPNLAKLALLPIAAEIRRLDAKVEEIEQEIEAWHRANAQSTRLATIPGISALGASALVATIADAQAFRSGRSVAAWLGVVPRQFSSGGKSKLGRITKHANSYLRYLLVMGARNVLLAYKAGRRKCVSSAIAKLLARKPLKIAAVALANKLARIVWALLMTNQVCREGAA
jgi:transposase